MSSVIDNIISNLDSYINQFDKVKLLYDSRNVSIIEQAKASQALVQIQGRLY